MKIKWVNKYSNETGFVKSLNEDKTDFINASEEEAGEFSEKDTLAIIDSLKETQDQNVYIIIKTSVKTKTAKTEAPAKEEKPKAVRGRKAKAEDKTAAEKKPTVKKPAVKKEAGKKSAAKKPAVKKAEPKTKANDNDKNETK